jgi:hypothetical protein
VQVSQCISQNTTSTVVSLVDDMLQTKRMTIEDLIEATEVCYVTLYELKLDLLNAPFYLFYCFSNAKGLFSLQFVRSNQNTVGITKHVQSAQGG